MRPAPVRMSLLVSTDQDAKADAGFAITLLAEPVEADHLGLDRILRARRRRDDRCRTGNRVINAFMLIVSPFDAAPREIMDESLNAI